MIRAVALALVLSGCGAPAPVVWSTVGTVAGFGAKAVDLDKDVFDWWAGRPPAARRPEGCDDFSCL